MTYMYCFNFGIEARQTKRAKKNTRAKFPDEKQRLRLERDAARREARKAQREVQNLNEKLAYYLTEPEKPLPRGMRRVLFKKGPNDG